MRKMRIGQIGPLNLPIPPKKYGGTEVVMYWLCEGLTKRGHEVFLFAAGDSKTSARLCPIMPKSLWVSNAKEHTPYYALQMATIAKKVKELNIDILHDHLGPLSLTLYGQVKVPIVHTLHVPFGNKDRIWAYKKLNAKLVSISNTQRKPAPSLNYVATIYNGINIKNFTFNSKPKNQFVWVGELSPRKGILEVIKIAKSAKIKLIIVGRIPPPSQKGDHLFFKKHIEKELNRGNIKYVGEVRKKIIGRYYRTAKAFLYPLQWEEPFGLTMAESMACGTPVIAFRRGSVPEVIKHGVSGFVIPPWTKDKKANLNGFLKAVEKIDTIKRENCRKWVEDNFTKEKMVENYEDLFLKILKN